jgi:hypothetical protein
LKSKNIVLPLILLCAFIFIAACGGGGGSAQTTTNGTDQKAEDSNGAVDGEAEEFDQRRENLKLYSYPGVNYNNYTFKILIRGQVDEWDSQDIYAEEENGDPVNDAVFRRNVEVEEALGIKLEGLWVLVDSQLGSLRKAVSAGDATYDAVMLNFQDSSSATKQGLLVNLKGTEGVDLSKPWWDQNLIKETSVMHKTYFATGGVSIMTNDGTWTMMFNKQMLQDLSLPSLYELVKSGEWTIDKMIEMGKGVTLDLNGDGIIDHTDRVAFATTLDSAQGLFYSTGNRIVTKDGDDLPVFALFGDKLMSSLDKIYQIMRGDDNFTMLSADYAKVNSATNLVVQAAFEENRSLFYAEVMQCVIRLRQMDTEFGIIPLPKADAAQENYTTNIHAWASAAIAIPQGGVDEERSSTVVEALAYGGYKYITPAYYDLTLKTKHARDEESSAMLDIIFAGRSADLGYIDAYGGTIGSIQNNISGKKNTFASTIEKLESKISKDIEKAITSYEALD